mmetsp:Transcript_27808/g.46528  ORF Transcript_27808/g.46528 Transcript_27808/m.46528 type:complete len:668 (+) Transcript_27808:232-2235(+)|eukprot:CAMPEP_0198197828 /NCGR_PEP_ID=MMETSP1445-20131203/1388_1 /TAXON_ID=36898 /ORGANISM="Pyramimonas sp., Strain CCMP2087" /LENGTH=667 /DNA_ID=CAMNT_0043867225 /DNA_START=204 /DNA_END=2207 /DNA_ORIENTATION=+
MVIKKGKYGVAITSKTTLDPQIVTGTILRYDGSTNSDGLPHGQGIAYLRSGHKYDGTFCEGLMHGEGIYEWVDGITYGGSFTNNKVEGTGKYFWPKERATYEGEVKNGKKHGYGKLSFAKSDVVYEGHWESGYRHGEGKLSYNGKGTAYYEGLWKWGRQDGHGKVQYESGNYYEGEWREGVKNGIGKMLWVETSILYEGRWERGIPNGNGEQTWQAGANDSAGNDVTQYQMMNRYKGAFVDGARVGEGVFYYSTGARYQGQWRNNMKHGPGVFFFEDGSVFEGTFVDDKPYKDVEDPEPYVIKGRSMPVKLEINDLLAEELVPDVTYGAVNNLLLRYNTELKALYRHYATLRTPRSATGAKSYMLTYYQFWKLVRDCRISNKDLSIAKINVLLGEAVRGDEGKESLSLGPHNPETPMLFREFVEACVRIAHSLYHDLTSLERRVHHLVNNNILPFVSKTEVVPFVAEMEGPEVQAVIEQNDTALRKLYNHATCTHTTPHSSINDSLTCREFVGFMQGLGVAGTALLSLSECLLAAQEGVFPHDRLERHDEREGLESGMDYHALDAELIYFEFLESVARCAVKFYDKMKALPENEDRGITTCKKAHPESVAGDFNSLLLDYMYPCASQMGVLDEVYVRRASSYVGPSSMSSRSPSVASSASSRSDDEE